MRMNKKFTAAALTGIIALGMGGTSIATATDAPKKVMIRTQEAPVDNISDARWSVGSIGASEPQVKGTTVELSTWIGKIRQEARTYDIYVDRITNFRENLTKIGTLEAEKTTARKTIRDNAQGLIKVAGNTLEDLKFGELSARSRLTKGDLNAKQAKALRDTMSNLDFPKAFMGRAVKAANEIASANDTNLPYTVDKYFGAEKGSLYKAGDTYNMWLKRATSAIRNLPDYQAAKKGKRAIPDFMKIVNDARQQLNKLMQSHMQKHGK